MNKNAQMTVLDISLISLMVAIIAICSWITIPGTVPFTLQTFAIFTTLGLIGGRRGTIAIFVYLLLGMVGVPVFSNFNAGLAYLFGTTGGYLLGFIIMGLLYWLLEVFIKNKNILFIVGSILGLTACYTFGTAWFMIVYLQSHDSLTLLQTLSWCVFPFLIPDGIKMALSFLLTFKLVQFVPRPAFSRG